MAAHAQLPVYDGPFGEEQATRLLFRAGFGPRPGEARAFAKLGVERAVDRLVDAKPGKLHGPAPSGDWLVGGQFAPDDRWGHGHLQWLDQMVRSSNPLQERMALVWHDWFATSQRGTELKGMNRQIAMLRKTWKGPMRRRLRDVTTDHGMLEWLNGLQNRAGVPNENYARELMELFALGADRGAYTELDVRELARCLTGFTAQWSPAGGLSGFRYAPEFHDSGRKVLFRHTKHVARGKLDWKDAIDAVVAHPLHPSFVAEKLWGYFIASPIDRRSARRLAALYEDSHTEIEPLLRAILLHPEFYRGPSMVKPPVVYVAGLLRARGKGIDRSDWVWLCANAGQQLWEPPNVSGWNDDAWLDTGRYLARWNAVATLANEDIATVAKGIKAQKPDEAIKSALRFWGNPHLSRAHRSRLAQVAAVPDTAADQYGSPESFSATRLNVLRVMAMTAPEAQVC